MGGSSREKREKPHCQFHEIPFKGKTKKWEVAGDHSTMYPRPLLGTIKWHGAWRKYVIQYLDGTMMDKGCHKEVDDFIDEQMKLRRETRKKETTKIHICIDTMNAIRNMPEKDMRAMFVDENGQKLPYKEILDFLKEDLRKGHDFFCPCDNRKPNGRCAGHPIPDEPEEK